MTIKNPNPQSEVRLSSTKTLEFANGEKLDLTKAQVMGVLNVTPDSFSDGGRFNSKSRAVKKALKMIKQGAAIIDVGGESTRPGAKEVSAEEEILRVAPVIKAIKSKSEVLISLDSSKPEVMQAGLEAGADMLNDVRSFTMPGALELAAKAKVPVCIMHMQGAPATMQDKPEYLNVVSEVYEFLISRAQQLVKAGISKNKIIIDPGFGFGKTLEHNLDLLRDLDKFKHARMPLLAGISRKSMIGAILDIEKPEQRLYGSLSAAVIAVMHGAKIIRTHDVKPTVQAVKIANAVLAQ